jgi:integration host factor subunit alpha
MGYVTFPCGGEPGRHMTKAEIIETVYQNKTVGFSKKESSEIVEMVFDTLKATLERGEKIKISGFGNFVVRDKKARIGRNPQTGKEIEISARRVLTFRPSQVLKNLLNGLDEDGKPLPDNHPARAFLKVAAASPAAAPPVEVHVHTETSKTV